METDLVKDSKSSKRTRKEVTAEIADKRRRGLTEPELAKLYDCSVPAISKRLRRAGVEHAQLAQFREDKSAILEQKQQLLLNALDKKKVEAMSGKDLMIAAAVAIDKQRLIDGHSASGGNISLLLIANKIHMQYQNSKGGEVAVVEAEVIPAPETTEVDCGEA